MLLPVATAGQRPIRKPLSSSDVRAVVDAFANAYETEDGAALGQLLTNDVERVLPSGSLHSRKAVVSEYEGQFATNATESYDLDGSTSAADPPAARAPTTASAVPATPSLQGHIVLDVVRDRGLARIALIAITPRP